MDKNMDIENSELRQPEKFRFDERLEWYQVNNFLIELARASKLLKLGATDIVHLGGTASFYRTYQAFGPRTVMHYRGTHDMDVISFKPGALQQTLDFLVSQHNQENSRLGIEEQHTTDLRKGRPRLHRTQAYSTRNSLSLPDKKSVYLTLDYADNPGISSGFELDVYESAANQIRFNNRIFTKDRIVLDRPETLELKTLSSNDRGLVSIPSMRDYLIIKTDIIDFSRRGLRTKDKFDILATLQVCQELGVDFENLLGGIVLANPQKDAQKRLQELEKLLRNPFQNLGQIPSDYPFLPSPKLTEYALGAVRQHLKK